MGWGLAAGLLLHEGAHLRHLAVQAGPEGVGLRGAPQGLLQLVVVQMVARADGARGGGVHPLLQNFNTSKNGSKNCTKTLNQVLQFDEVNPKSRFRQVGFLLAMHP